MPLPFQGASSSALFVSRLDSAIPSLFQKLSSDDQFLYFGSSFIDAQSARVAVNLDGLIDDTAGGFGREKFCLARFSGRGFDAGVLRVSRAINQQPRRV